MFSWIIESRGIQAWSFCNRILCASGIQLDVEANRLVGALLHSFFGSIKAACSLEDILKICR